ncbi:MAG TPA: ROK family protein [Methylomirabilota bacterium]|nr:ROK family protein [Methylomirabilota bacterium]
MLGVDVGGTMTAAGIVSESGEVLVDEVSPTHPSGPGSAIPTILGLIEKVRGRGLALGRDVVGIGVGVPGPVDVVSGRISEHVPHVPELAEQPLASMLAERFGIPAFVDNDCNALALAEWMFGAGRGTRSMVLLAPGTGFGTGIVLEGRLVRGAHGYGAELGHAPVKFDGPRCWCGGRGCLALYASGRGLADAARIVADAPRGVALRDAAGGDIAAITAPLVFRLADAGDRAATALVDEACQALGAMIGTVVNGLNPEVIVLTGGVTESLRPRRARILEAAAEYAFRRALEATRIVFVPGDKRVTMRGAAALVLYETRQEGSP